MSRSSADSTTTGTAVEELRSSFDELPVGLGVSSVGVFLGLLTGVRMYLLPASQWRFELGVVAALAAAMVVTGIVLATTDVPVPRARRAEILCLKGLGVMGLSTLGLFLVGTPFGQGMATPLCLSDVLLTGGAVGGLGIGMLRRPHSERGTGGADDLRNRPASGATEVDRGTEADGEAETDRGNEADQSRDDAPTIRLPIPPQDTPESALDVWLEVLADPRCRHVLHYFTKTGEAVATIDELGTHLGDAGRQQAAGSGRAVEDCTAINLHHCVLPKMDEAGVLDYDARTQTVRYREHPALEAWLAAVEPFDGD